MVDARRIRSCRFARAAPWNWSSSRRAWPTPPTCGRARPPSTTACRSSRATARARRRNDFTIDGVANVANDRVAYSPPSAAVEEFKIQTATYDAAIGNAMGASVNMVTKSGTNRLPDRCTNGSVGRDSTRRTTSTSVRAGPSATTTDNRFGAAVGGPIVRTGRSISPTSNQPVQGADAGGADGADRAHAQRRLLRTAGARAAVPDLRPVQQPVHIRHRRAGSFAIRSPATSSRPAGSVRSPARSSSISRCPTRPARPTAATTTSIRRRSPSRPTTR